MDIKEQIAIMQAYADGAKIEYCEKGSDNWYETPVPLWDWYNFSYRVKYIPTLRPYKNAKEFIDASAVHGPYLHRKNEDSSLFAPYVMPVNVSNTNVEWLPDKGSLYSSYSQLMNGFSWQDGTECGVVE